MSVQITCVAPIRNRLGEGAVWDEDQACLWWVDISAGLLHCLHTRTGDVETIYWGEPVGCLAVRAQGGLVLGAKSGFWLFDPRTGTREHIHDPEPDRPLNRFNDGTTDAQGRFWVGTLEEGGNGAPGGSFYCLDADLSVRRWKAGFHTINGLAFSPDGERMFFSDSHPSVRTLWAAQYVQETGTPGDAEVLMNTKDLAGRPDGGTVDAEGCYWMAGVGGGQLYRLSPQGALLRIVDLPISKPTKPMFGGPDLDVLFVTSIGGPSDLDGGLFAVTGLGVAGVPQTKFAG